MLHFLGTEEIVLRRPAEKGSRTHKTAKQRRGLKDVATGLQTEPIGIDTMKWVIGGLC